MGCENRHCDAPGYGFAEADLHNLWPALSRINSSRSNHSFGELPGEENRRFTDICEDYERSSAPNVLVEPRDKVKGELARSLLYMALEYDLPLGDQWPMLLRWHFEDPPTNHERWRNELISELQGTRNPFVDW